MVEQGDYLRGLGFEKKDREKTGFEVLGVIGGNKHFGGLGFEKKTVE